MRYIGFEWIIVIIWTENVNVSYGVERTYIFEATRAEVENCLELPRSYDDKLKSRWIAPHFVRQNKKITLVMALFFVRLPTGKMTRPKASYSNEPSSWSGTEVRGGWYNIVFRQRVQAGKPIYLFFQLRVTGQRRYRDRVLYDISMHVRDVIFHTHTLVCVIHIHVNDYLPVRILIPKPFGHIRRPRPMELSPFSADGVGTRWI